MMDVILDFAANLKISSESPLFEEYMQMLCYYHNFMFLYVV